MDVSTVVEHAHSMEQLVATKADIESLRREIVEAKADMLKWVAGLFVAQTALIVGTIITLVKLFSGI